MSSHLLLALVQRVPRLLVIATSRSKDLVPLTHLSRVFDAAHVRMTLPRLPQASITGMICELLEVHGVPQRLAEFVMRKSEGLPLHAEQLILALHEQGLIEVDGGRCRIMATDLGAAAASQTLHSLIVSRVDALRQTEQLVVKVASVVGRLFDLQTLREVHPIPADIPHLEASLDRLVDSGILLEQTPTTFGRAYAFRHVLIQEATYELLSYHQRRGLHRDIANFLERHHTNDLQPHYAQLADHWERAEDPKKTIDFRLRAADAALQRYANDDVLMHADRVDRALVRWGVNPPPRAQAELFRLRGEALHALTRFTEAEQALKTCAQLNGNRIPSSRSGHWLLTTREVVRQVLCRFGVRRGYTSPSERHRYRLVAHLHTRLAEHAYFMGDGLAVVHRTLTALNLAERAGAISEIIEGLGALAIGLGAAGQYRLASFYRNKSIALADAAGGLQDQALSRLFASVYSFDTGEWDSAIRLTTEGAETYERLGDKFRYQSCCVIRAFALLMRGDYASAEALLSAFGPEAETVENLPVRAWILSALSVLDMIHGRPAQRILARITRVDDRSLPRAERLMFDGILAAAHLQIGETDQARRSAEAAFDSLLQSASTVGAAASSICAAAVTQVALSFRERDTAMPLGKGWHNAHAACLALRSYAGQRRSSRPGALRITGYLAAARGQRSRAITLWRRALRDAEKLAMPLEQAACHLALAATRARNQRVHQQLGAGLLEHLGADPWRLTAAHEKARSEEEWFFAF
jgi:adenylate cyclase